MVLPVGLRFGRKLEERIREEGQNGPDVDAMHGDIGLGQLVLQRGLFSSLSTGRVTLLPSSLKATKQQNTARESCTWTITRASDKDRGRGKGTNEPGEIFSDLPMEVQVSSCIKELTAMLLIP